MSFNPKFKVGTIDFSTDSKIQNLEALITELQQEITALKVSINTILKHLWLEKEEQQ